MTLSSLLRIAAAAQLAIALLNLFLARLLDWKADLDLMPLLLREVFHVHSWFISITLGIFGVMTLRFAEAMAGSSNEACRWLTAGIGIFWAIRTVLQVTYYSGIHWHGRPVRTAMHVALLATYGGLALVYMFSAFEPGHDVNIPLPLKQGDWSDAGKRRLLSVKGEPLVFAEWYRVMFLHYQVEPSVVYAHLPAPFGLELHQGKAIVSLVALTMRRFRANPVAPFWAQLFATVSEQRFLNLRTYVRHDDEPGAFFFWSWLSRPWGLPLPIGPLGFTCDFAESEYHHEHEKGGVSGVVRGRAKCGRFAYRGHIEPRQSFGPCIPGSLAEFALERFSGYFWHRGAGRVFRAWHPAWLQAPIEIEIEDDSLAVRAFPWFAEARFIEAHYAPGFDDVWIGRPHRLPAPALRLRGQCQGPSEFLEMR